MAYCDNMRPLTQNWFEAPFPPQCSKLTVGLAVRCMPIAFQVRGECLCEKPPLGRMSGPIIFYTKPDKYKWRIFPDRHVVLYDVDYQAPKGENYEC
ncbi:hypothetical protein AVEN_228502-1 [Araneus ventricosus]|uniref:Uncharacterized protein n=1 Tax=Araneus ventricosus TaxID=182803 RepID=A0A4Y2D7J3_ARAVE|nr:hypothetical protein AVEN_228502-1 [Araneus ventricosus]